MMTPPTSTQEVVLCLDDETMQTLIVGVADHLQDASSSEPSSQHYTFIQSSEFGCVLV